MAVKKCLLYAKKNNKDMRYHLRANGYRVLYYDRDLIPKVTFSISPTPDTADVKLTAEGYEQVGKSISVIPGTVVRYKVSQNRYETVERDITINDETLNYPVVLEPDYNRLNVIDYEYTFENYVATLTKYIGTNENVDTPEMEKV